MGLARRRSGHVHHGRMRMVAQPYTPQMNIGARSAQETQRPSIYDIGAKGSAV